MVIWFLLGGLGFISIGGVRCEIRHEESHRQGRVYLCEVRLSLKKIPEGESGIWNNVEKPWSGVPMDHRK